MQICPDCNNWTHEQVDHKCIICLEKEVKTLRKQVLGLCDRVSAQSDLLSKIASAGIRVNLRECWVNADDLRKSCDQLGTWSNEFHTLVLESIAVAVPFRKLGFCKTVVEIMRTAVETGLYDLAIVEGVQNPILADALTRWGWKYDSQIMDFYWQKESL